jgi:outer membrane lipoprotein-sorting protein
MLVTPILSTQAQQSSSSGGTSANTGQSNAPSKSKVDPAARAILDRMVATYKNMTSYSGKFDIQKTGLPEAPSSTGEVAWQKPNKFKIVAQVKSDTITYVYDGTRFSYATSEFPGDYVQVTPRPDRDVLTEAMTETATDGTAILMLMLGQDPTRSFDQHLQALSLGNSETVTGAGKDTDVVVAAFARTWSTGTVTYVIGKNDHLLRRVALSQTTEGKTVTVVETHSDIKVNSANSSTFRFVPVPGSERVEEPEPIQDPAQGAMGPPT